MERLALGMEFDFAGFHWYLPELELEGAQASFSVIAPLDARRVKSVRERFQEREQAVPEDPLARALFEKELLPQLPWPRDIEVQLEQSRLSARTGLLVADGAADGEAALLRRRWPQLCPGAFAYERYQWEPLAPLRPGGTAAFTVRQAEKSIVLALSFSLPGKAPCFCHPLTGVTHTLDIRRGQTIFAPWDKGLARGLWLYGVTPPLGPGESLSIHEAHRQGGGAVGYSVREPGVTGAFSSVPYDQARPPENWEFFLERLYLPVPPPLQLTVLLGRC